MHPTLLLGIVTVPLCVASPWSGIFIDTSTQTEILGVVFDVDLANATDNGVVGVINATADSHEQASTVNQQLMMVCGVRIDRSASDVAGPRQLHHVLRRNRMDCGQRSLL